MFPNRTVYLILPLLIFVRLLVAQPWPEATNLPLFILDTDGATIPDGDKISANLKIIHHENEEANHPEDTATDYNGLIGIEIRGHHSASFPQRPYALETRTRSGENNNVSLLGFPEENDWILLSNYNDKSFMRNKLSFDLFRAMGHYAPRSTLCEVILNDEYRGIYLFCEKIKRDKNRVDIATLNPDENEGDNLTGGYIFKVDYYSGGEVWQSSFHPPDYPNKDVYFVYHTPDVDAISDEQKSYLQQFVYQAESALYSPDFHRPATGYRQFFDVFSFVDYFIISELSRNVDGYKKSRFFYKDKDSNNPLLHAGPVWDFDWAWKNIRECFFANTDGSGWSFHTNDCHNWPVIPGWYVRLLQDFYFTHRLIDRYFELRQNLLNLDSLFTRMDVIAEQVDEARERHFELYPIALDYRAPEVDAPSESYEEEVDKLKAWIQLRLDWLDSHIPELEDEIIASTVTETSSQSMSFSIYPNPVSSLLKLESPVPVRLITLYNTLGQQVLRQHENGGTLLSIPIGQLPAGIYLVQLYPQSGAPFTKKLLIRH